MDPSSRGEARIMTDLSSSDASPRSPRNPRNMKFSLYPARPRTASGDSGSSSPLSPLTPTKQLPPLPSSPIEDALSYPSTPQRSFPFPSASNDASRPHPPPQPILNHRPSEASRLRALNNGYRSHSSDGRSTPELQQDYASRPRQTSGGLRKEPSRPSLHSSNTFPLRANDGENLPPPSSFDARQRGLSTSSSISALTQHSAPLIRPSMSIPDYHAPESVYSRQRNLSSAGYRPSRGLAYDYNAPYRDQYGRPTGFESDEVRASIRSALTTNSSFMGTSATERSSVMTKSSSATSIYGKDEGMSVDDAIGMYEMGFQDSGVEDNDEDDRPETADSQQKRTQDLEQAMNDDILPPRKNDAGHDRKISDMKMLPNTPKPTPPVDDPYGDLAPPNPLGSNMIIRDSASFFKPGLMDTPKSSPPTRAAMGMDGNVDFEEGYFSGRPISRPGTRAGLNSKDPARDRYGFKKQTQHTTRAQFDAWNEGYTEYLARRRKKWLVLQKDSGLITEDPDRFPPKSVKVKRFVRKGIPPEWRGAAWFYYAGGPKMVAKHYGVYDHLIKRANAGEVSETDNEIIERDLNRTFPDNVYFKPDPSPQASTDSDQPPPETPMLQSLRRVLRAFSIYNPKIGYCQSLNFLAGLLLLFMDEEKSFWMLNIITGVYLPGTHEVNLEGANVDLGVLMTAIKDMMPSIWAKIGGELDGSPFAAQSMRLPPITLCTTAWFMSCFIGTLPIETTLRVWDSFFYEGSKTLFRIALTIFKIGETEIKAVTDPMEIFQVVQTIPRRLIDANLVMESCFKRRNGFGHISQETIEKGRAERRRGYARERERIESGASESTTPAKVPGRKNTLFSRKRRGPSDIA